MYVAVCFRCSFWYPPFDSPSFSENRLSKNSTTYTDCLTELDRSPCCAPSLTNYTMTVRGRVTVSLMIFLSFVAFASYHKGTGSTAWLQWLTLVIFLFFGYVFDSMFTNAGSFMFDPDADNWRRKTEALGR